MGRDSRRWPLESEPFTGSVRVSDRTPLPFGAMRDAIGSPLILGLLTVLTDVHGTFQGVAVDPIKPKAGVATVFVNAPAVTSISRHPVEVDGTFYEIPPREAAGGG
jgi:hypothetical protein